ncbi:hypothetical protein CYMTET_52598 [Cymbomonas tetramitiformis]|uniref:Uncharacterized protein n=1 Tax=Cymbomonas tetramitiformis TaxID=36881 RepID=A0AAE0BJT9_9CHLO|nr:hypothetical protein CYMTET_52598 [Cymbomonas tetramitiformis]
MQPRIAVEMTALGVRAMHPRIAVGDDGADLQSDVCRPIIQALVAQAPPLRPPPLRPPRRGARVRRASEAALQATIPSFREAVEMFWHHNPGPAEGTSGQRVEALGAAQTMATREGEIVLRCGRRPRPYLAALEPAIDASTLGDAPPSSPAKEEDEFTTPVQPSGAAPILSTLEIERIVVWEHLRGQGRVRLLLAKLVDLVDADAVFIRQVPTNSILDQALQRRPEWRHIIDTRSRCLANRDIHSFASHFTEVNNNYICLRQDTISPQRIMPNVLVRILAGRNGETDPPESDPPIIP